MLRRHSTWNLRTRGRLGSQSVAGRLVSIGLAVMMGIAGEDGGAEVARAVSREAGPRRPGPAGQAARSYLRAPSWIDLLAG
jgi:hypothetical protein